MNKPNNPLSYYWIKAIEGLGCEDLNLYTYNHLMQSNGSKKIRDFYEEQLLYQVAVCDEFGFWNPKLIAGIWFLNYPFCIGEDNFIMSRHRSIDMAQKTLSSLCLNEEVIQQIVDIIDEAYSIEKKESNIEYRIISDIRMYSAGYDYESFIQSLITARQRYSFMDEDEFFEFECKQFKVILERGFVYFTPYFRHKFEEAAKQNIEAFLKRNSV